MTDPASRRQLPVIAPVFDLSLAALLAIWLCGGIPTGAHVYLRHGADLRRAMIFVGALGFWLEPWLRQRSLFLRMAAAAWKKLQESKWRWRALAAVTAWACGLGALQALALRFPMYDVGIFHQVVWSLGHGKGFWSTISGAGNFLLDHLSLTLALFAPLLRLAGDSPVFLPVIHPLLIFGGAAAWIWLAERAPGASFIQRQRLAAATLVFAVTFDSLWGNLRWGFHETAISFFFMSWAMAWLLTGVQPSRKGFWAALAFILLAALSKETLLVDGALLLVTWAWLTRKWREVLPVAALLLTAFFLFEQLPHPADKNYFHRYYAYLGTELGTFARAAITDPGLVVRNVGSGEILRYLKTVLLPFLALPLLMKGRERWYLIAILPSFLSALLATYPPLRQGGFHYVLELWPVLATLTVIALSGARAQRWLWAWVLVGMFLMDQDPWRQAIDYGREAAAASQARARMAEIPREAGVVASELSGTWLAGRPRITRWPDLRFQTVGCPDWIVLRSGESGLAAIQLAQRCWSSKGRLRSSSLKGSSGGVTVGDWVFFRRN